MTRIALLLTALALATSAAATSLVSVVVTNPTDREFRISYEQDPLTGQRRIFRVNLRDDNTASFELSLPERTELQMTYSGVRIPLYIGPEDRLAIRIDGSEVLASITFDGPSAADNAFLAAYAKAFPSARVDERGGGFLPFTVERAALAEAATGDVAHYGAWVEGQLAAKRALLAEYRDRISAALANRYYERARYQAETYKIAFLLQNQRILGGDDLRAAAQQLGVTGLPASEDLGRLESEEFKNYLRAYAQYLALPNAGAHDERTGEALFRAIREGVGRPWRHYLMSELIVNAFDYLGNPNFGLDRYPELKRDGAADVYRKRVEEAYGDVLNLVPNALAPNIVAYTDEGQPLSLSQLGGQVVYVSFWASWCKPCLENFRKYDGIRAQLEAKGVVLLNVDIDDDEYDWRRALERERWRGTNVRATKIDELKRVYNLSSIPAYYIIDKHGRIVVLPEGDNRDLLAAFDEIIAR